MVGIVMASPPRDVPLSPVSIATLPALDRMRDVCVSLGHRFVDRAGPEHAEELAVALWDFGSIAVKPAWIKSSTQTIAWSLESPLVAHRAYHRLPAIGRSSDVVLGFPGVANLIEGSCRFKAIYWPSRPEATPLTPWEPRRFAVMVNSNKNVDSLRGQVAWKDPYRSIRRLSAVALARSYRLRGSWQVPNLYRKRLEVIESIATAEGFDLWGVGWGEPTPGARRGVSAAIRSSYRGVVADKIAALGGYRFALCFENTRFPGYISEKLFDALRAGTIPVYLGAPDVASYVPEEAYINVDSFDDLNALVRYLRGMDQSEAHERIAAGRRFLASPQFERFSEERFLATFIEAMDMMMGSHRGSARPGD